MGTQRITEKPVTRETGETNIELKLNLDGSGAAEIDTGVPFFDHMLTLFSKHGLFDVTLSARGDTEVDYHHLVEDVGIVLGQAIKQTIADKAGIHRYGFFLLPMDECLARCVIDLSNRAYFVYQVRPPTHMVRDFHIGLFEEFFRAVAHESAINLHLKLEYGSDPHHIAESLFKAFARALDVATQFDVRLKGQIPSSKGTLNA